ncbi:hypothetical protein C8F04DRAFT_1256100 [Mycena alexandri]|uniref:DUF6697 domain-containing protein n=1 Tax=Mycena alexandri TaxID=1745969 RepID=A0AAD6T2F2_9AGAR|nr:hypothetical protein C8F04DRAFT_1256100 [Mycena alexandri]
MATAASSSEYAHRAETLFAWAEDCKRLAVLKEKFDKVQAELEQTWSENVELKTALQTSHARSESLEAQIRGSDADLQVYRTRAAILERQLTAQGKTINEQNSEIQQLRSRQCDDTVGQETHFWLLENYNGLYAELHRVKGQLIDETATFRRKSEEQNAYIRRLNAELENLKTNPQNVVTPQSAERPAAVLNADARSPEVSAEPSPTAVDSTSRRDTPQEPESAYTPQVVNDSAPQTSGDEVRAPQAESTSRLSTPIIMKSEILVAKQEVKEEEYEEDIESPSTYLTPLPDSRRKELNAFPELIFDVVESAASVFSRGFLSTNLGGSHQPLIARACNVKKFLCPNLSKNPWCPRSPGTHGYMFVGLGNESETFREPEQLNLFLSAPPKHGRNLEVKYLGLYEARRVPELLVAEWNTLSPAVRDSYADIVASRVKKKGTQNAIHDATKAKDSLRVRLGCAVCPVCPSDMRWVRRDTSRRFIGRQWLA